MPLIPEALITRLSGARRVVALTGSGISAESGVPTFRDAQTGLWARYRPEDLATPEAFERDPKVVWEWYAWRRELVARAEPNAGHRALVELARCVASFTLITQNVDGLHQRAGSTDVIEFHGNIARTICANERVIVPEPDNSGTDGPPRCPRCNASLRPDVVWFGETIPRHALDAAVEAAHGCDVFLSIGTSSQVYPAASLLELAHATGACVVEVNPNATAHSGFAAHLLDGAAGTILPALVAELRLASGTEPARGAQDKLKESRRPA